ncbi:MAG: histidine kinase [Actinomycetia bacterium]|nr:histidine kinase [Actinomycetes bacterium]
MTPDAPLAPDEPDEPELMSSRLEPPPPRPPGHARARRGSLRRLSDRTALRTKLITAVLALVIAALAAISITSVYVLRNYLTTQNNRTLQSAYQTYAANPDYYLAGDAVNTLTPVGRVANLYVGLLLPGGQFTSSPPQYSGPGYPRTPNRGIPSPSVPDVPSSQAWATANSGNLMTLGAQSGPDSWRVIASPVTVPAKNSSGTVITVTGTLVVAWDLGNIDAEIRWLITVDLMVSGGVLVVLALVTIAVVRANLRPLDDIELTAGQIAAGHLNHRIAERDERTEIGRLGRSLNAMLSQIETAFHAQQESEEAAHRSEERMRRFIADASHELRTPLTTLRGFAEFYRQRGGVQPDGMAPEELDRIMRRLESEASRMGLLVEDLLQLARLDQQRPLDIHTVDLLALAADAVQDARMVAPERKIELTVAPGAAFLVEGDEPRLRQVIGNLVANARTHTPPEASITVSIAPGTLESGAAAVVLAVIDDGRGMTAEQAQHIFERFYRADAARNRASGGTGLGLAIVAGLVTAHGGEVSVRTAPGQGADFRVKLPLSADALYSDESADDFAD